MGIVTFGEQASATVLNNALEGLSSIGQDTLNSLLNFRETTLFTFQNAQSYINSRRILAARTPGAYIPLTISASDFACIDQGLTTGSIRSDSGTVTCKETSISFSQLTKFKFTSSTGVVTPMDTVGDLYTVISNEIPTGTFDITLPNSTDCTVVIIDTLANPVASSLSLFTSSDGITYTQWTNVSQSGYRFTAFGQSTNTNYIRLVIVPSAPDNLSGENYSFGITDLTVRGSEFAFQSEFDSRAMLIPCVSQNLYFSGNDTTGLTYYVSITSNGVGNYTQTPLNSLIPITEVTSSEVQATASVVSSQNVLSATLPSNVYLSTLRVYEVAEDASLTEKLIIPGLSSSDPNISAISSDCIYIQGESLILLTQSSTALSERNFQVNYCAGPSNIYVKLKVVLNTGTYGSTPTFKDVYFEAV